MAADKKHFQPAVGTGSFRIHKIGWLFRNGYGIGLGLEQGMKKKQGDQKGNGISFTHTVLSGFGWSRLSGPYLSG
jgi:hypothetical protein